MNPTNCFSCGKPDGYELVFREPEQVVRHGISFSVENLQWFECSHCGEAMSTPDVVDANAAKIDEAYCKRRDEIREESNLLSPTCIRKIRDALGESQQAMSNLFGVGVNGFQKYETDKSCPSKPTDLLLRLLAAHPSMLRTLKALAKLPANSFETPREIAKLLKIQLSLSERAAMAYWADVAKYAKSDSTSAIGASGSDGMVNQIAIDLDNMPLAMRDSGQGYFDQTFSKRRIGVIELDVISLRADTKSASQSRNLTVQGQANVN